PLWSGTLPRTERHGARAAFGPGVPRRARGSPLRSSSRAPDAQDARAARLPGRREDLGGGGRGEDQPAGGRRGDEQLAYRIVPPALWVGPRLRRTPRRSIMAIRHPRYANPRWTRLHTGVHLLGCPGRDLG